MDEIVSFSNPLNPRCLNYFLTPYLPLAEMIRMMWQPKNLVPNDIVFKNNIILT